MDKNNIKLHVLVDSREPSVSIARSYFVREDSLILGEVAHIRGTTFSASLLALLNLCAQNDQILISVHYLSEEQLVCVETIVHKKIQSGLKVSLASYACFPHLPRWCERVGATFLPNPHKRREDPGKNNGSCKCSTKNKTAVDREMLDRIWIQYRLMLSIISRLEDLSVVCRRLILSETANGDSLANEYARALRFFKLGEPDMAGGSYSSDSNEQWNAIDDLRLRINKIAATDFNVLVKGESGSGKETIAWAIHELSARRDKPFIAINCAGLPDELLESEMFGYMKGSHNQALEDTPGLFDIVSGGTLFLDELPDMSPRIQAKLLRCLESGEFRPIGGTENRYTDARIIAAGQPERLENPHNVRPDLKSRLCQLSVEILPLREVEKRNAGTIYKIAFVLMERYTWTRMFRDNSSLLLTPADIKRYQEELSEYANISRISGQEWRESNIRELNNFLRQWIVFGDVELDRLSASPAGVKNSASAAQPPHIHDEVLRSILVDPQNRAEFKALLEKKPLRSLKEAYIRHLYTIYSRIIDGENMTADTPKKATQKELARLVGVTENTISRHLN